MSKTTGDARFVVPAKFAQAFRQRVYDLMAADASCLDQEAIPRSQGKAPGDVNTIRTLAIKVAAYPALLDQLGWARVSEEIDRTIVTDADFAAYLFQETLEWTGSSIAEIGTRIERQGGALPEQELLHKIDQGRWLAAVQQELGILEENGRLEAAVA